MVRVAAQKFAHIEGSQRAAAFAYNAFFALFPLILLMVALASLILDRSTAGTAVIGYIERYVPIGGEMQRHLFDTVLRVVKARRQAGILASVMLIWAATQFFTTLVHAANRAWGTEGHTWWQRPLKNITLLVIMVPAALIGVTVPVLGKMARGVFQASVFFPWAYALCVFFVPRLVLFLGLSLFYKFAPRRHTRFSEVWISALCATVLLQAAQNMFVLYLQHFSALNAVYGAFGGTIALMLWIYVSGLIFIFCACLCAAQAATGGRFIPAKK